MEMTEEITVERKPSNMDPGSEIISIRPRHRYDVVKAVEQEITMNTGMAAFNQKTGRSGRGELEEKLKIWQEGLDQKIPEIFLKICKRHS